MAWAVQGVVGGGWWVVGGGWGPQRIRLPSLISIFIHFSLPASTVEKKVFYRVFVRLTGLLQGFVDFIAGFYRVSIVPHQQLKVEHDFISCLLILGHYWVVFFTDWWPFFRREFFF